jgi:acyl-CoA reductase-like NAD-dependent aldehyde dehydrogenase
VATTYTSTRLSEPENRLFEAGLASIAARAGEHGLLVAGEWRQGQGGRWQERNPARLDEVIGTFTTASPADVADAVAAARAAQAGWRRVPAGERIDILARAAALIKARSGEFAAALCREVGKNRLESMGEVDEAVELIGYYNGQAAAGFDIELAVPSPDYTNSSVMRPFGCSL